MDKSFKNVDDIPKRISDEDKKYFISTGKRNPHNFKSIHMEIEFKRWIRNFYKLWDKNNPLTLKNYKEEIIKGADHNPKHPDNVSDIIYNKFVKNVLTMKNKDVIIKPYKTDI